MVARKSRACDPWVRAKKISRRKSGKYFRKIRKNNSTKIIPENSENISENRRPKSAKIGALFREKIERFLRPKITGDKRKTASKNRAIFRAKIRKNGPVLDVRRRKISGKIRKNNLTKIPENSENNSGKIPENRKNSENS